MNRIILLLFGILIYSLVPAQQLRELSSVMPVKSMNGQTIQFHKEGKKIALSNTQTENKTELKYLLDSTKYSTFLEKTALAFIYNEKGLLSRYYYYNSSQCLAVYGIYTYTDFDSVADLHYYSAFIPYYPTLKVMDSLCEFAGRAEFEYSDNNQLISKKQYTLSPTSKTIYTYNKDGLQSSKQSYLYRLDINSFKLYYKTLWYYNSLKQNTQTEFYSINYPSEKVILSSFHLNLYNYLNQKISDTLFEVDPFDSTIIYQIRFTDYKYNLSGQIIKETTVYPESTPVYTHSRNYYYNASGIIDSIYSKTLTGTITSNKSKDTWQYDDFDHLPSNKRSWRKLDVGWEIVWETRYEYDSAGNNTYEIRGNENFISSEIRNFYSLHTIEKPSETTDILLYPNPAQNLLYVKLNIESVEDQDLVFSIWTIDGKKVSDSQIHSENRNAINISFLSSGFYIYRVQQGEESLYTGKFIKE